MNTKGEEMITKGEEMNTKGKEMNTKSEEMITKSKEHRTPFDMATTEKANRDNPKCLCSQTGYLVLKSTSDS